MSTVEWFGPEKPTLGPIQNGTQTVKVMYRNGMAKTYTATPEKVDEFIKEHRNIDKKNTRKQWFSILGGTALGAIIGGMPVKVSDETAKEIAKQGLDKMSRTQARIIGGFGGMCLGVIAALFMSPHKKQDKLAQQMFENQ